MISEPTNDNPSLAWFEALMTSGIGPKRLATIRDELDGRQISLEEVTREDIYKVIRKINPKLAGKLKASDREALWNE